MFYTFKNNIIDNIYYIIKVIIIYIIFYNLQHII
jgi:hypothetical protein